jgi:bloom syndrome protein
MYAPEIHSSAVSDYRHLQVCKNPEKTRKKKEALSPVGAIDQRAGHLQRASPEDEDDYPVPQVRAAHAPLQQTSFSGVHAKPKSKIARKPNPEDDDSSGALPRVASTSTVLAPIGVKTNYVGPALLRSRQAGLKRSGSSENSRDGSENSKKPRSELSARVGHGLGF